MSASKHKRRGRGGRDANGHMSRCYARMRRLEKVVEQLGLCEEFKPVPMYIREQFCQIKYPDPVVEFDSSFPDDDEHRALRKTIESQFREATVKLDGGIEISVRDMFSIVLGLKMILGGSLTQPLPQEWRPFFVQGKLRADAVCEKLQDALVPIHDAVFLPLFGPSRLDRRLLNVHYHFDLTENQKQVLRLVIGAVQPQVRQVRLDGEARQMYRVGSMNTWEGVKWLTWHEDILGRFHKIPVEYPVYIQSHALRRLRQRAHLPKLAPYLEQYLYDSLDAAEIVERQGRDLLVPFRIWDDPIGYLVVTALDDLVAVRTFKFLTMENTPEARKLKKVMGLRRPDVDWLGLDELSAFTRTDLSQDAELREMFEQCGCGHLFELADQDCAPTQPKPFAAEMRKYLRMAA